jgi:RNA polymerase sigma-70 factor (ECF subfamily)
MFPMEDEGALVAGLRAGDARAFDRVYAAFSPRLRAFLVRMARRSDVAEDLLQEVWLKVARACPSLSPDTRLAPLLFTVARNTFLSHRRWAMLDLSRLLTLSTDEAPFVRSPEEEALLGQETRAVEHALGRLVAADREVLLLVGVEGLPHQDVAVMLGVSDLAMRKRLSRARERLAEELANQQKRTVRAIPGGETP